MAAIIDPELVEATWLRVAALAPGEVLKLQRRAGKSQPEVVGFVIGFTSELSPGATGLALYVMDVVHEIFRSAPVKQIKKVKDSSIIRHWNASQQALPLALNQSAGPPALAEFVASSSEPAVMQYVVEALTDLEQEDPVPLDPEELGHLLAVLRTVVESLHQACRPQLRDKSI